MLRELTIRELSDVEMDMVSGGHEGDVIVVTGQRQSPYNNNPYDGWTGAQIASALGLAGGPPSTPSSPSVGGGGSNGGAGHGAGSPAGEHQHGPFGPHGDMGLGEAMQDWVENPGHNLDHLAENLGQLFGEIGEWLRNQCNSGCGHPNNPRSYE